MGFSVGDFRPRYYEIETYLTILRFEWLIIQVNGAYRHSIKCYVLKMILIFSSVWQGRK